MPDRETGFEFDVTGFREMGVRLDDYMGLWAVEVATFRQQLSVVQGLNLFAHVKANEGVRTAEILNEEFSRTGESGSIAVISLSGTLTKGGSSLSGSGSTVYARRAIRKAVNDESVSGILLRIDSPGGTVAGTQDLAEEVASAVKSLPVYAYCEDMCASAAYWIGSQATKIFAANRTTLVGSIGTFMAIYDLSKMFEKEGAKAIVVKAGEFKGAGVPGTEITDEQVADWQSLIDKMQEQFTAGVSKGRSMSASDVRDLADGRVHVAADAKKHGLIDGIQSLEKTLQQLQQVGRKASSKGRSSMSDVQGNEPSAATYKEIVAACSGIDVSQAEDAMFVTDCLGKELTAAAAGAEWCKTLKARVDLARQESSAAQKKLEDKEKEQEEDDKEQEEEEDDREDESKKKSRGKKAAGVRTVGTKAVRRSPSGESPADEWNAELSALMKDGMSRQKAVMTLNRKRPELREALVAYANSN